MLESPHLRQRHADFFAGRFTGRVEHSIRNADTNYINKWQGERKPGLYALNAANGEQI